MTEFYQGVLGFGRVSRRKLAAEFSGLPVHRLQRLLGHQDIHSTLRYVHWVPEYREGQGAHGVLAPNARLRPKIIPSAPINANTPSADYGDAPPLSAPTRMSWALKQVFEIDIEQCPQCGGTLKIIAAIEHPPVIAKILAHLGLSARAPPRSPARLFDRLQIA